MSTRGDDGAFPCARRRAPPPQAFVEKGARSQNGHARHPAADRLLLNMLCFAAGKTRQPLAELPADFNLQLKRLKYRE